MAIYHDKLIYDCYLFSWVIVVINLHYWVFVWSKFGMHNFEWRKRHKLDYRVINYDIRLD